MNYYTYMNRNQIKSALINCAKTHNMSLSELASEAGVSPSTITGFVNDAKTRADHVLSMRTIGKLTKKFPDLANFLQIAEPYDDKKLKEVRVIGLVDFENNQRITPLEYNTPAAIMVAYTNDDYIAFKAHNVHISLLNRYYLCKINPIKDEYEFHKYLSKLVVVDCAEGRFLGYIFKNQDDTESNYYVTNLSLKPKKLTDCTNIKWIAPIDWVRP
jgi:transcriptional regulator with XRE-family HTH domain